MSPGIPSIAVPAPLLGVWAVVTVALLATVIARRTRRRLPAPSARSAEEEIAHARMLSHEIRTPLSLVRGAAELLGEGTPGPLTDRQRYFVQTILQNSSQAASLAECFLIDARLRHGRSVLDLEETDLRDLVRDVVRDLRRVSSLSIRLEDRGEPLLVPVDQLLMRQVVWNLVNNALRHSGSTAVTLSVEGGDEGAILSVSDDGRGMTQDQRRALFTPFASVSSTSGPGTGLGMSITRRIVEAHAGRLVVDTIDEAGTRVLVVLPRVGRERAAEDDRA
jgi:signal transduction histidine kinase